MAGIKIGIIGLGDIAAKAYLPVIGRKNLEAHIFTRDERKRRETAACYRFSHSHDSIDSLLESGVRAAFVHTSTTSHFQIVEQLLRNNIHVYVDKPVTYDYDSTAKLIALAEANGLTLMAGFNRRFAPSYVQLQNLKSVNMVIMQKNRRSLPGNIRVFVFDDYIHVIDTLLFLFDHDIEKVIVTGKKINEMLYHVVVQLNSRSGATAIGIMNRDSGTVEERVEVFTPTEKWVVTNLAETAVHQNDHTSSQTLNDWESTLSRRGFEHIIDAFLDRIVHGASPSQLHREVLRTHEVCEQVVRELVG